MLGSGPSNGLNVGAEMGLLLNHRSELGAGHEDFRGPQQKQRHRFQCEKAVKQGHEPVATVKGCKEVSGMSCKSCRFRLLIAGFDNEHVNAGNLSRTFETACGPLGPEDVSW
jgi:hypothetical protein